MLDPELLGTESGWGMGLENKGLGDGCQRDFGR